MSSLTRKREIKKKNLAVSDGRRNRHCSYFKVMNYDSSGEHCVFVFRTDDSMCV